MPNEPKSVNLYFYGRPHCPRPHCPLPPPLPIAICKRPLYFKPAETLRTYLVGPEQKFLFTFLRHPGVPPTNNHAEQSLRHLVIFRKICFGTRSESGLKTHSILPSLVQTARRQGIHPIEFLKILLSADTATAQAALYNNSS
jgi:hypothetical protein